MFVTKGTRKQGPRGVGRMSRRTAAWLAWSLCALCVVLMGLALLLSFLAGELSEVCHGAEPEVCRSVFPQLHLDKDQVFALLAAVLSLAYPTVGALIASRLPTNPIGWIFCGVGLLYAGQRFTEAYASYALRENLAFPGGQVMVWLSGVFVILLFPNGHLLSRRWRIV